MANLLDTHTLIWFINGDESLSEIARQQIVSIPSANFVSIVSLWEIAIKTQLGKLEMKCPFYHIYDLLKSNAFRILPVTFQDTLIISHLPFHHRDPLIECLLLKQEATI